MLQKHSQLIFGLTLFCMAIRQNGSAVMSLRNAVTNHNSVRFSYCISLTYSLSLVTKLVHLGIV